MLVLLSHPTPGIARAQEDLQSALRQLLADAGVQQASELMPHPGPDTPHPRTARVNMLKMSVLEALAWLRQPPVEHQHKWASAVSGSVIDMWGQPLCALQPAPHLLHLTVACIRVWSSPLISSYLPPTVPPKPKPKPTCPGPACAAGRPAARPAHLPTWHRPAR